MQQIENILHSAPVGVAVFDLAGCYESVNPAYAAMYGYTARELIGQRLTRVFPPEQHAWVLGRHQKFMDQGGSLDGEWEVVRRDGAHLRVISHSVRLEGEDGQPRRIVYVTDITGRYAMELEVRRFQSIVESSDDAIVSKSIDGIVTSWNPGAQAMFGYACDEMVGRSISVLMPPDRKDEEDLILRRLRNGEKVQHFETVRVRKDGKNIHVSVTISPIRDQAGKVIGASKIARDITERKTLEGRLLLTASVFANTNEGMVVFGVDGTILEVNPAFTRISGYGRDEAMGRVVSAWAALMHDSEGLARARDCLTRTGHYQGEHWAWHKAGQKIAVLLTVSAVRNPLDQVQNYIALFSDNTALRLRQEQLEHAAQHDHLTDLPNRNLFADRLHQAMTLARRQNLVLAVLYIDLDGFKQVNDLHGHATGDALLISIAKRLKDILREADTLARIGGDEFAAVLFDVKGLAQCEALVERVRAACADPAVVAGRTVRVSASIGFTLYPDDDVRPEQLMAHADEAMYRAKNAGKNQVRLFASSLKA